MYPYLGNKGIKQGKRKTQDLGSRETNKGKRNLQDASKSKFVFEACLE